VGQVYPDWSCAYSWIERDRFIEKATNLDGDCLPADHLDDPTVLLDPAEKSTGSGPEICRIRYKDSWQYSLVAGGTYVLGGYRVMAYPAHIERNRLPTDFTPWFLHGMDNRVLHMIRQDGHIYIIRVDEPIPDLSKLKPTQFRIPDMIPIDDALRQCAKKGHNFGPFGCVVCGDVGEVGTGPHMRDFGFGPVLVELNLAQDRKKYLDRFRGIDPPSVHLA
jgi:hypothetical protein